LGWTPGSIERDDGGVGKDTASREVSRILRAAHEGQPVDTDALLPLVYDQLRAIAAKRMSDERPGHTLQATALVHEAYLKLVGREPLAWSGKAHFYGAAAEAMRRILIDHARGKGRAKRRGARVRLPHDVVDLARREDLAEILSVDEAVRRLEEQDPRMATIVRLRFYAGLSVEETAEALGITERTVYREWLTARTWLEVQLREA
jgi:RNA polymerase sigma factor (TIGR02999 family)